MAVSQFSVRSQQWFVGLSTDTKPTVGANGGDLFFESDTANQWIYTGAAWVLQNDFAGDDFTALTLTAAGVSTVNSSDFINGNRQGISVVVDITAISGTGPTLTVTLQGKDVASGKYYTLLASAALSTVSTTRLFVAAGLPVTANVSANSNLPRTMRVQAAVAGTGPSVTATIGVSLV